MKEGLGDILYFLAMIAFFVISAIAKSKKGKKNVVTPPQPSGSTDGGSEFPWFDDVFKDEEESPAIEEVESAIAYERIPVSEETEIVQKDVRKKREAFKYSEVEGSEFEGSFWDDEEFDLKRAIVFSEILKRPEL